MDSGRSGTPPEYLVSANERQYLAKLCWLLQDAGTHALRAAFDSFHPPLSLRPHLGQHHVRSVLKRLRDQKVLSEKQWRVLYPTKKQEIASMSSDNFDAPLLAVLLQFICHLSPPYPHGWSALPLPQDSSLSADVVRIQMFLQQAGSLGGVRHEEYPVLWKQVVEVLLRMGGPEVRVKITRIDQETLTPEQQGHFIALVKNSWGAPDEGALGRLRRMGAGRFPGRGAGGRGGSNKRRPGEKGSGEQEGISAEERVVLRKCHRQLCDVVMAEDIVDRLVQGHVLNFADRQEILTPGKNLDRMQILVSKVTNSKFNAAFKVLMDNLKVKYPRVYESLNKVKQVVQREGVSDHIDVVSVCQEGLATHYRSLFSRVTPLPWAEVQSSIRDVYVPLEVSTEDGQKLPLSGILPPVVTSGRGKRVLVEGESGTGKTYLAAMLTYQWASQRTSFNNHYQFLIYLDARTVRGSLAAAVHSLVFPENFNVDPEEFWRLLESHARDTIFVVDGFDEDHTHDELKKLILGERLRHASVLLTSRPEARAARWMNPDDRLYILGLSDVNVSRCLKSYAVVAQMTSEEYDDFHDVISGPGFELRSQLANPYVCLLLLGVYLSLGAGGLSALPTLTALLQRFLVAMATSFLKKLRLERGQGQEEGEEEEEEGGVQVNPELVAAISQLQTLAYRTLVTRGKLLNQGDLGSAVHHLRAALDVHYLENIAAKGDDRHFSGSEEDPPEEGEQQQQQQQQQQQHQHQQKPTPRRKEGARKVTTKGKPAAPLTDSQLLSRVGLLHRVGAGAGAGAAGGGGARGCWAFTCSVTREFLAARHLADMAGGEEGEEEGERGGGLGAEVREQKILRHARFAQTASFLCALLLRSDPEARGVMASVLEDITIQILKHGRRINFKDDASSTNGLPSEDGEEGGEVGMNGAGGAHLTNFSHCLQALAECSPSPTSSSSSSSSSAESGAPDPATQLPKSLPRTLLVQRDGLIPVKCLQGLALAVRSPSYHLTRLEIELLPFHVYQSNVLGTLAQALSENGSLQNLVVRWHGLALLVTFLKTCLARAPALCGVVAQDVSRQTVAKNVSAATWAGLQEVCSLLRNTRSFSLAECGAGHVVAQWVLYLPSTIRSLRFPGCAFNSISAADLGSKLEKSEDCHTLDLSDTYLETSDLSALFHDLKLNSSLRHLSLAGSHLDRSAAGSLGEYIRLNSSLRRLDLRHCHVTTEACGVLAGALLQNYSLTTLDLTEAEVSEEGRQILLATKEGEITWLGFEEEYYA